MISTIEAIFQTTGIEYGKGEQAFAAAGDNDRNPQNAQAVLIENITKPDIVDRPEAFADLIVPKREVFIRQRLFSFLAVDETNDDHRQVLRDMLSLALRKNGSENNTLYLNIRRNKNSTTADPGYVIMSVAYLHLWSVQTDAMKRTDQEFLKDGQLSTTIRIPPDLLAVLRQNIQDAFPGIIIESVAQYAPLDILLQGTVSPDEICLAARKVLRCFEDDSALSTLLDKGVRLMVRKVTAGWQGHVLTGAPLQPISKKV